MADIDEARARRAADEAGAIIAIPLPGATLMLGRGQVKHLGVSGPEPPIHHEAFFQGLARFAANAPSEGRSVELLTEPVADRQAV